MSTAGPLPEPPQVPLSQIWLDRADAMYRVGRVDGVLTGAEDATISALIALFYLIREGHQDEGRVGASYVRRYIERCSNCGLTFGSHRADSIAPNQCPGHESRMDWGQGPGTVFEPTGIYRDAEVGQRAKDPTERL